MKLPASGREYAHWTIADPPSGTTLEVSFSAGVAWFPLEHVAGDEYQMLVAGPDVAPSGAAPLVRGRNAVLIRASGTPEVVIRSGGVIEVS